MILKWFCCKRWCIWVHIDKVVMREVATLPLIGFPYLLPPDPLFSWYTCPTPKWKTQ